MSDLGWAGASAGGGPAVHINRYCAAVPVDLRDRLGFMLVVVMRRVRWIYPILVAALIGVYRVAAVSHVPVVAMVGLVSVAAIGAGVAVYRPIRRLAWVSVAAGVAVVAAGEISYDVVATGAGTDEFPSLVDVLFLAAYPPLAAGLLWLGVARTPARDVAAMIDTAALSLGGSLLVWVVLVRPTVDSLHLSGVAKVVAVAGRVGDAVVVAAAARLVTLWPRNLAAVLLGAAIVALVAGDVLYGVALIDGTWRSGGPTDLCLLAFLGRRGSCDCAVDGGDRIFPGVPAASGHWSIVGAGCGASGGADRASRRGDARPGRHTGGDRDRFGGHWGAGVVPGHGSGARPTPGSHARRGGPPRRTAGGACHDPRRRHRGCGVRVHGDNAWLGRRCTFGNGADGRVGASRRRCFAAVTGRHRFRARPRRRWDGSRSAGSGVHCTGGGSG